MRVATTRSCTNEVSICYLFWNFSFTPFALSVVAPASLPGGYEVTVEGKDAAPFVVTIPEGGVQSGDIFLAPIPDGYKMEELLNVPKGRWKDDIFDVFKYGFFHPHLWCAMCCQEIAMGQVMQRMRLSWLGHRTLSDRAMSTYTTVLILVICYTIYSTILDCLEFYMYNDQDNFNHAITAAQNIGMILFLVWSIYALKKTRQHGTLFLKRYE